MKLPTNDHVHAHDHHHDQHVHDEKTADSRLIKLADGGKRQAHALRLRFDRLAVAGGGLGGFIHRIGAMPR